MSTKIPEDLEGKINELESDSSRPSKFDSATQNLATELAIAQFSSDPLQKMRHICEAFFFLTKENQRLVLSDDLKQKDIEQIYDLILSFQDAKELPIFSGSFERRIAIPWRFANSAAKQYFETFVDEYHPFDERAETYFTFDFVGNVTNEEAANRQAEFHKLLNQGVKVHEEHFMALYYKWLYTTTFHGWGVAPVGNLKNNFISKTMPRMLQLSRSILEHFVNGDTWENTLLMMRGISEGKEKKNASSPSF